MSWNKRLTTFSKDVGKLASRIRCKSSTSVHKISIDGWFVMHSLRVFKLATGLLVFCGLGHLEIGGLSARGQDKPAAADELAAASAKPATPKLQPLTTHTYTATEGNASLQARIEDFRFIAGHWLGSGLGGQCEETWSPPLAGEMQGMFQFVKEGKVVFRELFALRPNAEGIWTMHLKHFNADMTGWEGKDEIVTFQLLALEKDRAIFDGVTMHRKDQRSLSIYVAQRDNNGDFNELVFDFSAVEGEAKARPARQATE